MEFVFFLAEKFLPCTKSEIRNLYCFQGVSRKQIQNSNFQMFKTLWFSLEYDFLRFGHLNFGNLRIARPGATEAGECHRKKNPVWARVSNFDIRISYFPACPG